MRILFDTHVVLSLLDRTVVERYPLFAARLFDRTTFAFVSVVSLWEISIKTRLRKLDPGMGLDVMAEYLDSMGLIMVPIEARHVVTAAEPEPATRDPFDRLLLAQCQVDDMVLATIDRALVDHRLALKTPS